MTYGIIKKKNLILTLITIFGSNKLKNIDSLQSHLDELIKKHQELHDKIEKFTLITDEVRRLKTKKLWLKDEIYRIQRQIESTEKGNGSR